MVRLSSNITIGNFQWSGVHEVRIKRSIHSYVDSAFIKIPSIAQLNKNGKALPGLVTTGEQFNDGDKVVILLGYDGLLQEEFRGFVKRRDLNMPLEVECEGYSWQLKRNKITKTWKSVSVKDLLAAAIVGTDIAKVICDVDITLINLALTDGTGADILEYIMKETDHTLGIYFIEPDVLWCGLVYNPTAAGEDAFGLHQVKYRLGYNVVKDNGLKERVLEDNPITTIYMKRTAKGQRLYGTSVGVLGQIRKYKKFLNRIANALALKELAQENQYKKNYIGYEGNISAFLVPYALPGYTAYVEDARYAEKNGIYIIEGTEVTFGVNGARRNVHIGPKIGWANA